jgi:CRP-like cAMP-binding protein
VEGKPREAAAGDVVGMYETLAGTGIEPSVTAVTEARLLRIDRSGLFELLADHTDLLQGIFSILLRLRSGRTISNVVSTP